VWGCTQSGICCAPRALQIPDSRTAIRSSWCTSLVEDEAPMSTTIQEQTLTDPPLTVGGRSFRSRLLVGTGKYRNNAEMVRAIEASGAEGVTVAATRVDLDRTREEGV